MPFLLFFFLLFPGLCPAERCHPDDRNALNKFRNSFTPTPFATWLPVFDCCDWYGVTCDETTNRVTRLMLTSNLSGSIPDTIEDLTHLDFLWLHKMPFLEGEIPAAIGKLPNLRYLHIKWTSVSGPVPQFLPNLKNLEILDLSFNKLSGKIPSNLATLQKIGGIDLSRNQLTGSIPESFGHFPPTVSTVSLILSHNKLSGKISPSLAKTDFSRIDVSRNNFSGDASMFFGKGKSTDTLIISRNNFEFDFSRVSFTNSLVTLDISHNKIYGNIPSQILDDFMLQEFNVSYNRLCGKIPSGWKLRFRPEGFEFDNSTYVHNRCLCGSPLDPCKV